MSEFSGSIMIHNEFVDKTRWRYWRIEIVKLTVFLLILTFFGSYILTLILSRLPPKEYSELAVFLIGLVRQTIHGGVVGFAGWLMLKNHVHTAKRWIGISSVAYGVAFVADRLTYSILIANIPSQALGTIAFILINFIPHLIPNLTRAGIQSIELRRWFINTRPWLMAALVDSSVFALLILAMNYRILVLSPLLLSLLISTASAAIQAVSMSYMLKREFQFIQDQSMNDLGNTAPA